MDAQNILNALRRPFHQSKVRWRCGARTKDKTKAIPLAYVDAREVMGRLDEVFGLDWECSYPLATESGLLICEISVTIGDRKITRSNGAGDTEVEAEKGKASDAFKRAAVLFGVGKYLYSIPNTWMEIDNFGKFKSKPVLPVWATPEGFDEIMQSREEKPQ